MSGAENPFLALCNSLSGLMEDLGAEMRGHELRTVKGGEPFGSVPPEEMYDLLISQGYSEDTAIELVKGIEAANAVPPSAAKPLLSDKEGEGEGAAKMVRFVEPESPPPGGSECAPEVRKRAMTAFDESDPTYKGWEVIGDGDFADGSE
ncbi:MAG: hypothetical protein RLN62_02925 [Rickettsiales bacterium]